MAEDARAIRTARSARWRTMGALLLAGLCMAAASASPVLPAHTLDGRALRVPSDLPDPPSLLVIGYSRRSRTQTAACLRRLGHDPLLRERLRIYQVVGLGSAPRLLRGAIVSGIRREVPASRHARFLVIGEDEPAWKAATGVRGDDDAHLLLVDGARIVWRGGCDPTTAGTLHQWLQRASDGRGVP